MCNINAEDVYDKMAEKYAKKNEFSVYNSLYERPATISLLPSLQGKSVFDAGCGGGILTEIMINQGAKVIAADISENLVKIARKRIGHRATFNVADISQPLPFIKNNSVDVIVSSLVLHYIENWKPLFMEFNRILKDNGVLVFSTHHPHADWKWHHKSNYFVKEIYEETWKIEGESFPVRYYHRTLTEMFDIFDETSFFVEKLLEPQPLPEVQTSDPKDFDRLSTQPHFLFFRLKKIV